MILLINIPPIHFLYYLPVLAIVFGLLWIYRHPLRLPLYAISRMIVQLLAVGFVLVFIFDRNQWLEIFLILFVMSLMASWIALRPAGHYRKNLFLHAFWIIGIIGSLILSLTTKLVLDIEPFYNARYFIPMAGMIYANAMNGISLAIERYLSEKSKGSSPQEASQQGLRASLIPTINSLMAVGLVSFPGMMTGQVLAGISPLIAVKYQIVIMLVVFCSNSICVSLFLFLVQAKKT